MIHPYLFKIHKLFSFALVILLLLLPLTVVAQPFEPTQNSKRDGSANITDFKWPDSGTAAFEQVKTKYPKLDSRLAQYIQLTTSAQSSDLEQVQIPDLTFVDGRTQVQITINSDAVGNVTKNIQEQGGYVTKASLDNSLLQAWLPISALEKVAASKNVYMIREPSHLIPLEETASDVSTSEGLAAMNAPAWHDAGFRGKGVKIAIVDGGFEGYPALLGSDLPASVTTMNFVDGESQSLVNGGGKHGTACAEIVYDIAPEATMYLVKVNTHLDLQEAVTWLIGQGVQVISSSIGWYNLSPGDGTGFFANEVTRARNAGILWNTAAGNDRESHWGGSFSDSDGDRYHEFNGYEINCFGDSQGCYSIPSGISLVVFLRWDNWSGPVNQDYDLYIVKWTGSSWSVVAYGEELQNGNSGQTPTEFAGVTSSGASAPYGVIIKRFNATRTNVNFELFAPNLGFFQSTSPRSLSNLADSPNAVTVAALDVNPPYPQEFYSSEGPTNGPGGTASGGNLKPDMSAFANVATTSYGTTQKFNGTSSATPHVAGATALVLSAYPTASPSDVRSFLGGRAIDIGPTGFDTQFGAGRLFLGSPPQIRQVYSDFTGDGRSDVYFRHIVQGTNYVWAMNGASILAQGAAQTVADLNWKVVGIADFTGDRRSDILWRHATTGQNYIWAMNGASTIASGALATVADLNWRIVAAADFTGDGRADILWRNFATGANVIWAMNGATVLASGSPPTVADLNWKVVFAGDFTGDGRADILWRNFANGGNAIWAMNGATLLASGSPPSVTDLNWQVVGAGDYTGDGRMDILWRRDASGQNAIWAMNGASVVASGSPPTVSDTNWKIVGTGDYTGDGKADILWRHNGSGGITIWAMNGATPIAYGSPPTLSDLNWRIIGFGRYDGVLNPTSAARSASEQEQFSSLLIPDLETQNGVPLLPQDLQAPIPVMEMTIGNSDSIITVEQGNIIAPQDSTSEDNAMPNVEEQNYKVYITLLAR